MNAAYNTDLGTAYNTTIEQFLPSDAGQSLQGNVQLVFTSPPFLLNSKKKYGNKEGNEYHDWIVSLSRGLTDMLTPDGSIVMEIGNSWEPQRPVMSTLVLRTLLDFLEESGLNLCQEFVWNNPAKLPTPARYVNVDRIRVKDSFTHVWWMSHVERPKAHNREVLVPYSDGMKRLLKTGTYNAGTRPSGHTIGETSFLKDNGGAIPGSVLTYSNTAGGHTEYRKFCRDNGYTPHPATMPVDLAEFFIKFLTDEGDTVFDPFGGSNVTGATAERLGRRWAITEPRLDYLLGSRGRFL